MSNMYGANLTQYNYTKSISIWENMLSNIPMYVVIHVDGWHNRHVQRKHSNVISSTRWQCKIYPLHFYISEKVKTGSPVERPFIDL